MSAGKGIRHSEYNASATEEVNLLQIWVFPKEKNINPRYDQKKFAEPDFENTFKTIVSPQEEGEAMWVNQDVYFSLGSFTEDTEVKYKFKNPGNGVYIFVIEGNATAAGQELGRRDAIGVFDTESVNLPIKANSKILVIDVPMN
jgi:hypothetical protein